MADYFTPGLDYVASWVRGISERSSTHASFPTSWAPGDFERKGPDETLLDYFKRVVDEGVEGELQQNTIEESALVLISLGCNDETLQQINVECFVTRASTIVDAYLTDAVPHYLRFDYDPHAPGPLFKEPQPHLHVQPSGEPRLGLSCPGERSLLAAFFDFLYRNYFHEEWMEWVRRRWEPIARRYKWETERLDTIAATFSRGNLEALRENHDAQFEALKEAVSDELDDFFPEVRRDPDEFSFVNL